MDFKNTAGAGKLSRIKFFWGLLILAGLLLSSAQTGFAHTRHYSWTQEYQTLPKGGFEIENSTTFTIPNKNVTNENTIEYQGELEYGVTDHLTVSHYEMWETKNVRHHPDPSSSDSEEEGATAEPEEEESEPGKDATTYKGFKFETKYRIGEKGKYWLDPLIYLEWETEPRERREGKNPNTIEAKIVLSKDLGDFNITYNQIMESNLGKRGRTEHNFTWAARYNLPWGISVGGEIAGNYWMPSSNRNEISMGPTVSYENKYFWVVAGSLFGVNRAADDRQVNVRAGVPF